VSLNESIVEDAALTWFEELGYAVGAKLEELGFALPIEINADLFFH